MEYNKQIELLKKIAFEFKTQNGELYYVGGFVRDKILGIPTKDIDIEIYNVSFNDAKKILSKYGTLELIGENFGILKLRGLDIDFAFPRKEHSTGLKHKDFEIYIDPFISKKLACSRRDFTINSIMQNVLSDEIIDNYNGITDLNNRIIKHIDSKTFVEDPLRVLRACQFSSRFDFKIDNSTMELCKTIDITTLSKERIYNELYKALLKSKTPSIFIKQLLCTEKFSDIFFTQNSNSLNNNLNTLLNILDLGANQKHNSNNPELFMISCLIFGLSYYINNFQLKQTLSKLSYKKTLNNYVIKLLYNNNLLTNMESQNLYELKKIVISSYNKLFNIDDVILFNKICNPNYNSIIEQNLTKIDLNNNRTITPMITGKTLKEKGIPPSSNYKEILSKCLDFQLQNNFEQLSNYLKTL